jgi:hypothetical protein
MILLWLLAGLAVFGAAAVFLAWSQGRDEQSELGVVSHQWLTEHRHSQSQDSQR